MKRSGSVLLAALFTKAGARSYFSCVSRCSYLTRLQGTLTYYAVQSLPESEASQAENKFYGGLCFENEPAVCSVYKCCHTGKEVSLWSRQRPRGTAESKREAIVWYCYCALADYVLQTWLVMDLCAGGTLHDVIKADAPFADDVIWSWAGMIARCMQVSHQRGLILGDVRAGKFLLDDGQLRLSSLSRSSALYDSNQVCASEMTCGAPKGGEAAKSVERNDSRERMKLREINSQAQGWSRVTACSHHAWQGQGVVCLIW